MTAGPILALVVQGNESVAVVKKLVGATEPKTSDVGTIRGDLTVDSFNLRNYPLTYSIFIFRVALCPLCPSKP